MVCVDNTVVIQMRACDRGKSEARGARSAEGAPCKDRFVVRGRMFKHGSEVSVPWIPWNVCSVYSVRQRLHKFSDLPPPAAWATARAWGRCVCTLLALRIYSTTRR